MAEITRNESLDRVESNTRSLKDALNEVREERAEIDDHIAETRVVEIARLEELADEIEPLVADINPADDRFDFIIGRGQRPRLWVDMTSFVTIGRDQNTFRFLKDTRLGRIVLIEDANVQTVGDAIARYVAEKIIERERLIEGDWIEDKSRALADARLETAKGHATSTKRAASSAEGSSKGFAHSTDLKTDEKGRGLFSAVAGFLAGIGVTIIAAIAAAWAFLPEMFAQLTALVGLS